MIGRTKEINELNDLYNTNEAELVAIYGRRRIGKTYLVDEVFKDKFTFKHAGLSPVLNNNKNLLKNQLEHFYNSLILYGMKQTKKPKSWLEAFLLLELYLQKIDNGKRQLLFFDELPWLDTPKSGFITAFEAFWNNFACHKNNIMVIVCGSANSWILDNLINNYGGLYNRVTYEIKLYPFTLQECEEYFKSKNIVFSRYDIIQSYMALGGIPYYLGYIDKKFSLAQNIDNIFFNKNAKLKDEYNRLFSSIFINPEAEKRIVSLLFTNRNGFTRNDICAKLNISDGKTLSNYLNALIDNDFVIKYTPFNVSKKQVYYKLIDPFCIFYLHFVENKKSIDNYFTENITSPSITSWRGFAYENLCFNHINQIKMALGVSGVYSINSAWQNKDEEKGMQVDLIIVRNDNVINMCEIKFYANDYVISKEYYKTILGRQETLAELVSRKYSIRCTLITTFGLVKNEYSGVFTNVITIDDLFK